MKIYCASDFHIGYEQTNYSKINEFLELVKKDGDKLILVGDTFDLWRQYPEIIIIKDPYKTVYENLLNLAKTISITIIPGNHDYNLNKISLPNIIIKNDYIENNIYFTHGWKFDLNQRIGSSFYYWIIKYFPYLYQRFFKKPSEIIKDEYDERSIGDPIHAEALKFANKNNCKIIMGHTHDPMISDKVIDCGDFIDSCSFCIIENDKIEFHKLDY